MPYLGDLVGYRTPARLRGRVLATGLTRAAAAARSPRPSPRAGTWPHTVAQPAPQGHPAPAGGTRPRRSPAGRPGRSSAPAARPHQPVQLLRHRTTGRPAAAAAAALVDLRDGAELDLRRRPVRRTSARTRRRPPRRLPARARAVRRPAGVGLFVWRLKAVLRDPRPGLLHRPGPQPVHLLDPRQRHPPGHQAGPGALARPTSPTDDNVPAFIRRRGLRRPARRLLRPRQEPRHLARRRRPARAARPTSCVADLSDWRYRPRRGQVAVDPELGRIAFGSRVGAPAGRVGDLPLRVLRRPGRRRVRAATGPAAGTGRRVYRVGPGQPLPSGSWTPTGRWQHDRRAGRSRPRRHHRDHPQRRLPGAAGLRARPRRPARAARRRGRPAGHPAARLVQQPARRPQHPSPAPSDCAPARAARGSCSTGCWSPAAASTSPGRSGAVVVRHCTLVPGWSLEPECAPHSPEEPSLVLDRTTACLQIERSILGTIEVIRDEVHARTPPIIHLATASWTPPPTTARRCPPRTAGTRTPCCTPAAPPSSARSTRHAVRDRGELRPHRPAARGPARQSAACGSAGVPAGLAHPAPLPLRAGHSGEPDRVVPRFTSALRHALATGSSPTAAPRRSGAAPTTAPRLGAFHDLYQPQREDNLGPRLAEYTPGRHRCRDLLRHVRRATADGVQRAPADGARRALPRLVNPHF